jgi:hypothetical protein
METHINIDVDKVDRVLLSDGWHRVRDASFTVATYGFVKGPTMLLNAIAVKGAVSHWARWTEPEGAMVACPLTAVLALSSAAGA